MDPTPKARSTGLFGGLSRILHLHRLPANETVSAPLPPSTPAYAPIPTVDATPKPRTPVTVSATTPPSRVLPMPAPAPSPAPNPSPARTPSTVRRGEIITDYDRILNMVREKGPIKLDEIARLLALKEEIIAQELQTLEDNGLVDVKYPAFGEPLIYYKQPES